MTHDLTQSTKTMKDTYIPGVGETYSFSVEDLYELTNEPAFHIGQSYERKPAAPIRCTQCKGTEFNVAKGVYFTGIRCITCGWETCVHEG